jgi:hypothetical protein
MAAAHDAGSWVEISEQELKEYGGWVAQVVEEMVDRREKLATFSGTIGVVIDIVGGAAVVTLSSLMSGGRTPPRRSVKALALLRERSSRFPQGHRPPCLRSNCPRHRACNSTDCEQV